MAAPISTRTRQRSSAPLLSVSTTLTQPSRIQKRTPTSKSRFALSPAPSTATASSTTSLYSALSFTTNATSPATPAAIKAIAATASVSFEEAAAPKQTVVRTKKRVVPWPSQIYDYDADAKSESEDGDSMSDPLEAYLATLQGALSRASSEAGSVRSSPA